MPMEVSWKVESWGDVTVPAGTFKDKVVTTNNLGEVETIWTSPNDGVVIVKRNVVRPATHPQGAGVLDAVAVQYSSRQVGISLSRHLSECPLPKWVDGSDGAAGPDTTPIAMLSGSGYSCPWLRMPKRDSTSS